jgi:hypothetical protein
LKTPEEKRRSSVKVASDDWELGLERAYRAQPQQAEPSLDLDPETWEPQVPGKTRRQV